MRNEKSPSSRMFLATNLKKEHWKWSLMCSSFLTNTCLMLAVMTLDYFPNQGDCSVALVVNFEQVLSFDYYLYFLHFLSSLFLLCTILIFITIVSKIISIKVVIIISFLVYPESLLFFPSARWWACSMSATKTLYCLFFISS